MNTNSIGKNIFLLSIPVLFLLIFTSLTGLMTPDFYGAESQNWKAQSIGQDIINLFLIAPALLIASIIIYRGNISFIPLWGGIMLYLIYTFIIYCFAIHFNNLFLTYCAILGLSFYSLLYFLYVGYNRPFIKFSSKIFRHKVIGIYFLLVTTIFMILWLSEIIPAIMHSQIPKTLIEAGLITNPVHILDLAVLLPGIFLTGLLLIKNKPLGYLLAPVILSFLILMDITIGVLIVVIKIKGMDASWAVTVVMSVLALISILLLKWIWPERKI